MSPKILDYEDGRIKVTAEAFCIPEIKVLLDKYDMKAEPYLAYVHLMTALDSPYINIPDDEKQETVVYDIIQTMGDFDTEEPMLDVAIEKFRLLYDSRAKRYYDSVGKLMDKLSKYADQISITDENAEGVAKRIKEAGATMRSYKDAEKQVEEELKVKMRGKNNLGDY